jgi:hypothetical protein
MNQKVGGLGHDPKTEPVEAQVEKNNVYCFEDQTIKRDLFQLISIDVAELSFPSLSRLMLRTFSVAPISRGFMIWTANGSAG